MVLEINKYNPARAMIVVDQHMFQICEWSN